MILMKRRDTENQRPAILLKGDFAKMKIEFNHNLACQVGVREAIIAQRLFDVLMEQLRCGIAYEKEGNFWIKASGRDLTASFPFYSKDGCLDALQNLRDAHILVKGSYNDSRFDHTYWHAFTRYGLHLMLKETEVELDDRERPGKEAEVVCESVHAPFLSWNHG